MRSVKKFYTIRKIIYAATIMATISACQTTSAKRDFDSYIQNAALAAEANRDYVAAANHYSSLYNPANPNVSILLPLARNLRLSGQTERAIALLDRSTAILGEDPALLIELGRQHLASGNPQQALPLATRAADLAPASWEAQHILALAHDHLDQHARAQQHYERAEQLSPNNASILNNRALSFALVGDLERALSILRQATAITGASDQVRNNLAMIERIRDLPPGPGEQVPSGAQGLSRESQRNGQTCGVRPCS